MPFDFPIPTADERIAEALAASAQGDSAWASLRAMYVPLEPAMFPGLATWVLADGRVLESLHPSALKILDDAMAACPDKALIGPDITQIAALLR